MLSPIYTPPALLLSPCPPHSCHMSVPQNQYKYSVDWDILRQCIINNMLFMCPINNKDLRFPQEHSHFLGSKKLWSQQFVYKMRHPCGKCWIQIQIICDAFALKFWYRKYSTKLVWVSSQRWLKITPDEHTSFTVAILIFYEIAVGSKELENDQERSWRWQDWSRAFLQERSLTELTLGLIANVYTKHFASGCVWNVQI